MIIKVWLKPIKLFSQGVKLLILARVLASFDRGNPGVEGLVTVPEDGCSPFVHDLIHQF